jgi:glycosyltransferase involved in cell wall biosynthesis
MKKLLVIIPFYNVEAHLEEAIEGVLQQTYQNFHLVLIDDASTDNSRKIAEEYKSNPKIDILYNTENKGCYYSVNKALLSMSNQEWDYWHYHGGDDVSDLTRFEKIMGYLEENPKVIGCKTTFVRVHYDTKEVDILDGQAHIGTSEGIAFYSRTAFDNLGYYDDTRFGGDTDYFWRLEAWIHTNKLDYQLGEHKECLYIAYLRKTNLVIQYDWTYDRPRYWQKSKNEIQKMIANNNFYREIF